MIKLDLSEWIEMCLHKIYTGPHAEEFIDGVREYEGRIVELEVKLAKAEELRTLGMEHVADYSNDPHLVEWANATLAELKGQK